jgi:phosphopantothenoylcysteine synthetase/decarboxylase
VVSMSLRNKKVLITCGPTWVPTDTMRVISNRSSGTLGQLLAEDFAKAGAKVTLLEGPVVKPLQSKSIRILKFLFFDELATLIKKELKKKYDVCIHAAAVSDYKIKRPKQTKLSSYLRDLKLDLIPTEKIVHLIKELNPDLFLVAFKLEEKITKTSAVKRSSTLFKNGRSDLVIANSIQGEKYSGYILDKHSQFLAHEQSRKELSRTLVKIIKEHV